MYIIKSVQSLMTLGGSYFKFEGIMIEPLLGPVVIYHQYLKMNIEPQFSIL